MSRISVTSLAGTPASGNVISVVDSLFYAPKMVVQTLQTRTEARTTYSAATTGNGTTITDLNLTITPKFASSLLVMTWMINAEVHYDTTFVIHQGGSIITTAGYEGYNNQAGNTRWSGFSHGQYESDTDSTMSNWYIQYAILASNTSVRTYAPAIRASAGTAYTFYLNRPAGSTGADSYEVTVSTGMIMEVAQ